MTTRRKMKNNTLNTYTGTDPILLAIAAADYVTINIGLGNVPAEVHKVTGRSVWYRGALSGRLYVVPHELFLQYYRGPWQDERLQKEQDRG
jgi:hypothetical protein